MEPPNNPRDNGGHFGGFHVLDPLGGLGRGLVGNKRR